MWHVSIRTYNVESCSHVLHPVVLERGIDSKVATLPIDMRLHAQSSLDRRIVEEGLHVGEVIAQRLDLALLAHIIRIQPRRLVSVGNDRSYDAAARCASKAEPCSPSECPLRLMRMLPIPPAGHASPSSAARQGVESHHTRSCQLFVPSATRVGPATCSWVWRVCVCESVARSRPTGFGTYGPSMASLQKLCASAHDSVFVWHLAMRLSHLQNKNCRCDEYYRATRRTLGHREGNGRAWQ